MRGPSNRTRQAVPLARRLRGMSMQDESLFRAWWPGVAHNVLELHADVPLGPQCDWQGGGADGGVERCGDDLWAYRLDAAVLTRRGWTLVECKPNAGHKALGQALAYRHWWRGLTGFGDPFALLVVTDALADGFASVYAAHGVQTWSADLVRA